MAPYNIFYDISDIDEGITEFNTTITRVGNGKVRLNRRSKNTLLDFFQSHDDFILQCAFDLQITIFSVVRYTFKNVKLKICLMKN